MDPTKSLKSIASLIHRVFHLLKPHIRRDEVEMQQFVLTPVPFADEYSLFITDYVGSPRLRKPPSTYHMLEHVYLSKKGLKLAILFCLSEMQTF
ncbi:uncharacterized protein LOC118482143 isoform X4 [Helianthus annuus]|uniref:uncharacterized protein LOC118482143 isoform X4 n=1 Tax=Helianthus annuus TaxID=4232 RepID=UPI001652D012|nr:uncharacterized protein LOC118482143 isoform X4 [Helianthus annuus]